MGKFKDAPDYLRCTAVIKLRDGSAATCGRYRVYGVLCKQHEKIRARNGKAANLNRS